MILHLTTATTGILERLTCGRKQLHAVTYGLLDATAMASYRRKVIRMEGLHA